MDSSDDSYEASDVSVSDEEFSDEIEEREPSLSASVEPELRSIEIYLSTFISFNDGVSLPFLSRILD
jgi:hypothetical protein